MIPHSLVPAVVAWNRIHENDVMQGLDNRRRAKVWSRVSRAMQEVDALCPGGNGKEELFEIHKELARDGSDSEGIGFRDTRAIGVVPCEDDKLVMCVEFLHLLN